MTEIIFLVENAPEGGYTARSLGFPIFTEADNWEELKVAIGDAVNCHFEEAEHPHMIRMHFTKEEGFAA